MLHHDLVVPELRGIHALRIAAGWPYAALSLMSTP